MCSYSSPGLVCSRKFHCIRAAKLAGLVLQLAPAFQWSSAPAMYCPLTTSCHRATPIYNANDPAGYANSIHESLYVTLGQWQPLLGFALIPQEVLCCRWGSDTLKAIQHKGRFIIINKHYGSSEGPPLRLALKWHSTAGYKGSEIQSLPQGSHKPKAERVGLSVVNWGPEREQEWVKVGWYRRSGMESRGELQQALRGRCLKAHRTAMRCC